MTGRPDALNDPNYPACITGRAAKVPVMQQSFLRSLDADYNLIGYVEACLSNALRLETYIQDADREGDSELAGLFRKAQADSRKSAEMGKQLLRSWRAS